MGTNSQYIFIPTPTTTITRHQVLYLRVPVGERHHDVEGGQGEHQVEEGPAVGHRVLLVVPDTGLLPLGAAAATC